MAKMQTDPKPHFTIFTVLNKIFGVVTGAGPFLGLMEELMLKQVGKMLRRMLGLVIVYLTMLAGMVILTIGGILLIIDYTTVPRGVAFALGGLVLISGSALFMQFSKK